MCGGDENPFLNFTKNPAGSFFLRSPQSFPAAGLLSPRNGFNQPHSTLSAVTTSFTDLAGSVVGVCALVYAVVAIANASSIVFFHFDVLILKLKKFQSFRRFGTFSILSFLAIVISYFQVTISLNSLLIFGCTGSAFLCPNAAIKAKPYLSVSTSNFSLSNSSAFSW